MHETQKLEEKKRSISGGGNSNWDNKQRRADEHRKKKVVMKRVRENFKTLLSIGKREGERTTEGTIDIWFTRGQSNCCLHNTTNGANNIVYNTSLC